jgi:heterodisulfide reductase subunit A2
MSKNKIVVIGGGIAGMEAARQLASQGFEVALLEKGNKMGGNVANWYHVFPDGKPAKDILNKLKSNIQDEVDIHFGAEVYKLQKNNNRFILNLTDGENIDTDAVIIATGFDLFDATRKEEYGYGVYDDVLTSADLEEKFNSGKPLKTSKGQIPKKIAFVHCVGSRDEKAGNSYCSKVCCITAVKQAIEIKQNIPDSEIFCFYMDLRLFDRYFEDIYYEAQTKYGINFIRGRLSEASEDLNGKIILKAEDTLHGKPVKLSVDLVILMAGKVSSKGTRELAQRLSIQLDDDLFIKSRDSHTMFNFTNEEGIFTAGTCTGPKTIQETIADARSAAMQTASYLRKNFPILKNNN